ncbi:hypothetical protein FDG95_gp452 [Pectobacterium phage vB_PcaM_CBB]|uniref:Uncharacterized protein n=1 Tax=Pectobacterium phage vB_PcaM_CBB TaxID=2772511 RepID=A0A1L2CVN3_9CAUD|nr:hypothetical protein FDG95_gp452 [Pectobacterium phage vB_PcaM_CBB]AMM44090.1 hypothetical protein CBB_527 [Pectobacterium phage vB_PcaM_CBB]
MYIEITHDYDVKEVAKDIRSFCFRDDITVKDFIALVEELEPERYLELFYRNVLENVKGELPDDLVELLLTSQLTVGHIIGSCKVSDAMVQNIIDNRLREVDSEKLISTQNLTFEQFETVLKNGSDIYTSSLGSMLGDLRNVEYALYVIDNWDQIPSIADEDIAEFRYYLFNGFGSVLLSDEECLKLFGFVRPAFSSEELREHEPCTEGWKRAYKWAGRSDTKYTWNEFIARHILANQNNVEGAKSDLEWLAESLSDEQDYFDHW